MAQIALKKRFAASAERAYDAWLDPDMARRFLYTTATGEVVRCEIDARVGGTFTIVDRRSGEEILHEGSFITLERPKRLVFTLRVPKYSANEDRIEVTIERTGEACELTLTTETPDEWAEDTRRGWAMILDVLDELLPTETPTCGGGLAQHAGVSRRMAIYLAEMVRTLELHRATLVLADPDSKREDDVYQELATRFRDIVEKLGATAERMASQRDLAMGVHEPSRKEDERAQAFARFVHEQGALASVLVAATARDEQQLASMQKKG